MTKESPQRLLEARLDALAEKLINQYEFSDQGFLRMTEPLPILSVWEDEVSADFEDELADYDDSPAEFIRSAFSFGITQRSLIGMGWEARTMSGNSGYVSLSRLLLDQYELYIYTNDNEYLLDEDKLPRIVSLADRSRLLANRYFLRRFVRTNGEAFGVEAFCGMVPDQVWVSEIFKFPYLVDMFVGLFDSMAAKGYNDDVWSEVEAYCKITPAWSLQLEEIEEGAELTPSPEVQEELATFKEEHQLRASAKSWLGKWSAGMTLPDELRDIAMKYELPNDVQPLSFDRLADLLRPIQKRLMVGEYLSLMFTSKVPVYPAS